MKTTIKILSIILSLILIVSVIPVITLAENIAILESKGFEIAHWGIPRMGSVYWSGGTIFSDTSRTCSWVSYGIGVYSPNCSSNKPNKDKGNNTVIGWGVCNLIPCDMCNSIFLPLNIVAPNSGDEFTVVAKTLVAPINTSYNITNNDNLREQEFVTGLSIDYNSIYEVLNFISAEEYDNLPTHIDPTYGFAYKELKITTTRKPGMTGEICGHVFQAPDFPNFSAFTVFLGFEAYNSKGEKVWDFTGEDLYNQDDCSLMGVEWGGHWFCYSGYEWKKGETGQMYGAYVPNEIIAQYGKGTYAMEFTMNISNANSNDLVTISLALPDSSKILASKTLKASDIVEGKFSIYSVSGELDPQIETGRVEAVINCNGNADVKVSNIAFSKLNDASSVISMIDDIEPISVDSAAYIQKVEDAYETLSSDEQEKVTNYDKLQQAIALIPDICAAKIAYDKINELDIENPDITKIKVAHIQFHALTEEQKSYVTNSDTLLYLEKETGIYLGELDNAEGVTAADALLALQAAVSKTQLTKYQLINADVNDDKVVDASDALIILQYAVGKITVFPCMNK